MSESVIKGLLIAVVISIFLIIFESEIRVGHLGLDMFKAHAEFKEKMNEGLAKKK